MCVAMPVKALWDCAYLGYIPYARDYMPMLLLQQYYLNTTYTLDGISHSSGSGSGTCHGSLQLSLHLLIASPSVIARG